MLRLLMTIVLGGLILLPAGDVMALQGAAGGHCDGDQHVLTIAGFYLPQIDGAFTGLVLVREAIGVCREPVTLPDPPLPFDPQPTSEGFEYTATAVLPAPAEAAVYRYTPYGVRPDGSLEILHAHCSADDRSYALIACSDVPLARGTVVVDPDYANSGTAAVVFDNCADDCWTERIGAYLDLDTFTALTGHSAWDLYGVTVDVYGTRTWCTMLGGDYHTVTRIELTTGGGCGSVPGAPTSWGRLKAQYR